MNFFSRAGHRALPGRVGFWIAIIAMLSAALFLAVCAGVRAGGVSFPLPGGATASETPGGASGFIVVDMSRALPENYQMSASAAEAVALGIGPLPESPSLFEDELVLVEQTPEGETVKNEEKERRWVEYYVKPAETLSNIAQHFGIKAEVIIQANELENPDMLTEGQELLIPLTPDDMDTVASELQARHKQEKERVAFDLAIEMNEYTIQEGDSLWSIANDFNLDINTLFGCNAMKDPNFLRVGGTLKIPNQDGVIYTVKSGDTLQAIGSKHGVSVESVMKVNGLADVTIQPGQKMFLPGAKPVTSVYAYTGGSSSGAKYAKGFSWPVVGRITSGFGWRRHPITRRRDFHAAIDIKAPYGRIIRASKAGRVVYSGWMGGYGRVLVIDHGKGYTTLYAHCSSLLVRKGQRVAGGQPIAKAGATGRATGTHLHFEIRINNKPVNPLRVLK